MKFYIIEGYNIFDCKFGFENWEFLGEYLRLEQAMKGQENFQKNGYVCRIRFDEKKNFDPAYDISKEENVHWEIFCDV